MLYDQLPAECQMTIYTEFLFKEFLFKFRRFFNLRKPQIDIELLKEHTKNKSMLNKFDNKSLEVTQTKVHKTMNISKF